MSVSLHFQAKVELLCKDAWLVLKRQLSGKSIPGGRNTLDLIYETYKKYATRFDELSSNFVGYKQLKKAYKDLTFSINCIYASAHTSAEELVGLIQGDLVVARVREVCGRKSIGLCRVDKIDLAKGHLILESGIGKRLQRVPFADLLGKRHLCMFRCINLFTRTDLKNFSILTKAFSSIADKFDSDYLLARMEVICAHDESENLTAVWEIFDSYICVIRILEDLTQNGSASLFKDENQVLIPKALSNLRRRIRTLAALLCNVK